MRHIATFTLQSSDNDPAHWFIEQMSAHGLEPSAPRTLNAYERRIAGRVDDEEFAVSFGANPTVPGGVILQVEPALGVWAALRGRRDAVREAATLAVHQFLSQSSDVSDLRWFRRKRVWQGGTEVP